MTADSDAPDDPATPPLAMLPGRLRDWAVACLDPNGLIDLAGTPQPVSPDGAGLVILLDDPATAIADLMALGYTHVDAVRRLAAVLSRQRSGHGAPVNWACRGDADEAGDVVTTLCHAMGLPVPDRTPAPLPPPARPDGALAATLLERFAAPLYDAVTKGTRPAALYWPRTIFIDADRRDDVPPARMEIVGPSRALVFGGYIALPPGDWVAEFELFFSRRACGRDFTLDMLTDIAISTTRVRPSREGRYTARLPFRHDQPELPVSMRVVLERGAIEGAFGMESLTLYSYSVS